MRPVGLSRSRISRCSSATRCTSTDGRDLHPDRDAHDPARLPVSPSCSDYVLAVIGPEWETGADALKLLCVVGIVKGLVYFTGPLLFAVAKPFFRATMLWFLAAVSVVTVVAVGYALEDASAQRQLLGMSAPGRSSPCWSSCR